MTALLTVSADMEIPGVYAYNGATLRPSVGAEVTVRCAPKDVDRALTVLDAAVAKVRADLEAAR